MLIIEFFRAKATIQQVVFNMALKVDQGDILAGLLHCWLWEFSNLQP